MKANFGTTRSVFSRLTSATTPYDACDEEVFRRAYELNWQRRQRKLMVLKVVTISGLIIISCAAVLFIAYAFTL